MLALTRVAISAIFLVSNTHATAQESAQNYPSKAVRWIVTFTPGASNDIVARIIATKLTDLLGHQFVIDNRGGAGGLVGAGMVATAPPDGYTLLFTNPAPNINAPLMSKKPPYQVNDFVPVIYFGYTPLIIATHPSFPAKTPKELISVLKANPGKYAWGSSGTGSSLHIGLALFQFATGIDVVHVPYKGSAPALTDLVSGQIQLMYTTKTSADGQIKAGRVKVLAVASAKRNQSMPTVPTLAEFGVNDAEAVTWFGMAAPPHTPRAIVDKLNASSNKVLAMPEVIKRFDEDGIDIEGGTPEQFARFISKEASRISALLKTGALTRE